MEIKDNNLLTLWYEGSNLPTDAEYESHIAENIYDDRTNEDVDMLDSENSESEYDSDEYASSETYSSSDEDGL